MAENHLGMRLRKTVETVQPLLLKIDEEVSGQKSSPEKWSYKEIIGHLIDSATNNHRRFVVAQLQDHLIFEGYQQERWVAVQAYQQAKWEELVMLWSRFNLHISWVISQIPEATLEGERTKHRLDKVAWARIPASQATNLSYFIKDYIDHLEHHLKQILPSNSF